MREWIQQCETCGTKTPHSHRDLSLSRIVAWLALVVAIGLVVLSILAAPETLFVSVPLIGPPLWLLRRVNARHEHDITCERCRAQRVVKEKAWRRRKLPTLDGRTVWGR